MLQETGETVTMGRSSASCNYQLSSSRLISRVHVKASYKAASNPFQRDRVEILCTGWNGIKLHCQGKAYELAKGKTFTSDIRDADVMIDVQDARVLVQWPRPDRKGSGSGSASNSDNNTWDEASSPVQKPRSRAARGQSSSPSSSRHRLVSPVSPSPAVQSLAPLTAPATAPPARGPAPATPTRAASGAVVVYEDEPSPTKPQTAGLDPDPLSVSQITEVASSSMQENKDSFKTESHESKAEELSEHDEENDPIVFSFGPYGENILPRMASFNTDDDDTTKSPSKKQPDPIPSQAIVASSKVPLDSPKHATVRNHIINQLAFSRLASTPFSTILSHLPSELVKKDPSQDGIPPPEIKAIIEETKTIGKVAREGKDAAGKPLESEYYYVPDFDGDESRKEAVVNGLRKPGLRNCRKQHKVCVDIFLSLVFILYADLPFSRVAILLAQTQNPVNQVLTYTKVRIELVVPLYHCLFRLHSQKLIANNILFDCSFTRCQRIMLGVSFPFLFPSCPFPANPVVLPAVAISIAICILSFHIFGFDLMLPCCLSCRSCLFTPSARCCRQQLVVESTMGQSGDVV